MTKGPKMASYGYLMGPNKAAKTSAVAIYMRVTRREIESWSTCVREGHENSIDKGPSPLHMSSWVRGNQGTYRQFNNTLWDRFIRRDLCTLQMSFVLYLHPLPSLFPSNSRSCLAAPFYLSLSRSPTTGNNQCFPMRSYEGLFSIHRWKTASYDEKAIPQCV